MSDTHESTHDENTTSDGDTTTHTEKTESFDKSTDKTVENADDELSGGYGGPAPVTPEDEKA